MSDKIQWKVTETRQDGSRIIEGVAYNRGMKERRSAHCSQEVWDSDDPDIFYNDESIRFTIQELRDMDLMGTPLCIHHQEELKVGEILHNWVDRNTGDLHIVAELDGKSKLSAGMITQVDNGVLSGLSMGYGNIRHMGTGIVEERRVDEISLCTDPFYDRCEVKVRASKGAAYLQKPARTSIKFVKATMADKGEVKDTTQEEILRQLAELKKQLREKNEALAAKEAEISEKDSKLTEADKREQKRKEIDDKLAEEYKESKRDQAEEVIAYAKELAEQDNRSLPEPFVEGLRSTLTNPKTSMFSELQVTAARYHKKNKTRITELETQIKAMKEERKVIAHAAAVEEEEEDEETGRPKRKRKDVKADSRGGKIMKEQADDDVKSNIPSWAYDMMNPSYNNVPHYPSRSERAVKAHAEPPTPQGSQYKSETSGIAYPKHDHSLSALPYTQDLWKFAQNIPSPDLDGALSHLAGTDFTRQSNGRPRHA
jgi:hypothetical protein